MSPDLKGPFFGQINELAMDTSTVHESNTQQTTNHQKPSLPPKPKTAQVTANLMSNSTYAESKKPPPPPPIRRTSSISNPNAITIGTLRKCGVSTYEEIRTLKRNTKYGTYEDVSRLERYGEGTCSTSSVRDIRQKLLYDIEPIYSNINLNCDESNRGNKATSPDRSQSKPVQKQRSEYQQAKELFENLNRSATQRTRNLSEENRLPPPLPPPPPVRRTSSISNPNAITMGTLRKCGVSTYEEIKTLKKSGKYGTYEDVSRIDSYVDESSNCSSDSNASTLTNSSIQSENLSYFEPIYSNLNCDDFIDSKKSAESTESTYRESVMKHRSEYKQAKELFENLNRSLSPSHFSQSHHEIDDEPLPPPPPEAYTDCESSMQSTCNKQVNHQPYNRISNIHSDFLQTLNAKLSVPQQNRMSPRLLNRRSMSLPQEEHDWDSDSGIVTGSSSTASSAQSQSIQQALMRLMNGRHSRSSSSSSSSVSSSSHRHKSPQTVRKNSFSLAFCDRESHAKYKFQIWPLNKSNGTNQTVFKP